VNVPPLGGGDIYIYQEGGREGSAHAAQSPIPPGGGGGMSRNEHRCDDCTYTGP
jgi:hypothetical protein